MILPILLYGDPVLRLGTQTVKKKDLPALKGLMTRMLATMRHANGVGLAAPQVGKPQRFFVADLPESRLLSKIFINTENVWQSNEEDELSEGCLSIPKVQGVVRRPVRIRLKYRDIRWELQELEVAEMPARIIQHEIDHLDGILFVDRLDEKQRHNLRHVLNRIARKQRNAQ